MGRGDSRRTRKILRRRAQSKLQARIAKRKEAKTATPARAVAPAATTPSAAPSTTRVRKKAAPKT